MKSKLVAFTIFLIITSSANSQIFECSFLQEKTLSGKANAASCAMNPEIVYSTIYRQKDRKDHCNVEAVFDAEDIVLSIDLTTKKVERTATRTLTAHGAGEMLAHYKRQGSSEVEAQKRVEKDLAPKTKLEYLNLELHKQSMVTNFSDPLTDKPLEKFARVMLNNFHLTDRHNAYVLIHSETNNEATLLNTNVSGAVTYSDLRFGKCIKR